MLRFEYTVTDPEGFHARPAGMFVKEAKKYDCVTTVEKNGKKADARKMFGLMGLGIKGGSSITVNVEGADEEATAAAMEAFLKETL